MSRTHVYLSKTAAEIVEGKDAEITRLHARIEGLEIDLAECHQGLNSWKARSARVEEDWAKAMADTITLRAAVAEAERNLSASRSVVADLRGAITKADREKDKAKKYAEEMNDGWRSANFENHQLKEALAAAERERDAEKRSREKWNDCALTLEKKVGDMRTRAERAEADLAAARDVIEHFFHVVRSGKPLEPTMEEARAFLERAAIEVSQGTATSTDIAK